MTSTEADIAAFIADIAVHYTTPKFDNPEDRSRWLKSYVAELRGASPAVLKRAAKLIIETRKNRYFPLVSDCRQAVREAAEEINFEQHAQTLPALRQATGGIYSQARVEFVENTLLKCELGRQAANEGWILSLRDFAIRENRLPDNRRYEPRNRQEREEYAGCSEIEFCKRSARGFDEAYESVLRGDGGALRARLEKLGDDMIAKRNKLCEEVLG